MVNMWVLDTGYVDVSFIFSVTPICLILEKAWYFDVHFQITQGNPDVQPGLKARS